MPAGAPHKCMECGGRFKPPAAFRSGKRCPFCASKRRENADLARDFPGNWKSIHDALFQPINNGFRRRLINC